MSINAKGAPIYSCRTRGLKRGRERDRITDKNEECG
jgi:hypothetical protein